MAGKDKLEFDVLAHDKASTTLDKVASASKSVGKAIDSAADKGSSSLKKLSKASDSAKESLSKMGDGAKKGLSKLTESLKAGPLALVGLGVGLGALVMDGFSQAMEKEDASHLLAAQLGASNEEMGKLGKISGDLYKNAFGESISEVNQVMKTVFQNGLATMKDGEDAIKGVTVQVMNYTKLTGEEALPVTRAISQMLKTGLAKNATEAFDILTRGVQKGLDKSEDLLDTVNEYGTQFRKLGLDGTQAFGLISQAIQAGARDSDIAADAIKEFSIRAIDGSTLTAGAFKDLGLSAKGMQEQIAHGGKPAAAGLDAVLDKLRAIKDPAERSRLAVALFGTQAEDLGNALFAMDLSTATEQFGQVAGAAERAGDLINDTTSNKLTTLSRTIKGSIVDAIGKYALPALSKFADWFIGPGKMVMVGWALTAAGAVIDFADKTLGALQSVIPALTSVGATTYYAAAAAAQLAGNSKLAMEFFASGKAMAAWGEGTKQNLQKGRDALHGWSVELSKAKTKVEITAVIDDLDQKLAKAQAELRDPGLTKERRATLTANIAQLTKARDEALRKLGDKNLIKTRTATLEATKKGLDSKIAAAKKELASKDLTRARVATLNANIEKLLRQKRAAQAAIDALRGKTVYVTTVFATTGAGHTPKERAVGGPVSKGQPYIVGEKRPELFVPDVDGTIIPDLSRVTSGSSGGTAMSSGVSYSRATMPAVLNLPDTEFGRFILKVLRKAIADSGSQGNVQLALNGRLV